MDELERVVSSWVGRFLWTIVDMGKKENSKDDWGLIQMRNSKDGESLLLLKQIFLVSDFSVHDGTSCCTKYGVMR